MKQYSIRICLVVLAIGLLGFTATSSVAIPGLGSATRKGVQEAIEYTARKFGINLAEDSGKHFAREAAEFAGKYGDDGIRALKGAGPEIIGLSRRYGKEAVKLCAAHSDGAAGYLAKSMDKALPVWQQFGKEGTELMVKHPGLAGPVLDSFGKKGLQIGQRLSTRDLNRFLVLASKAAGKKEKGTLVDRVLKESDKIIAFLWEHKWKLTAGATVYSLIKDYDTGVITAPAGPEGMGGPTTPATTRGPRNFIHYFIINGWDKMIENYPWIPLVLLALAMWSVWPFFCLIRQLPYKIRDLYIRYKLKFSRRPNDAQGY
ncbi:MAG: hypothetical protein JRF40_00495 [Deltaproteobacteria bacterium]|nr:hypothetical protein [Deltaproteobacteria bacterium]